MQAASFQYRCIQHTKIITDVMTLIIGPVWLPKFYLHQFRNLGEIFPDRYLIMNSPSPNSSVSQLDAEEQCTKSTLI